MVARRENSALPSPRLRALARSKFFFLHGDDLAKLENFKEEIVAAHLKPEERDENYSEYGSLGAQMTLRSVLGDVLAELSTVSLLPGSKRVVVVYGGQEFYEGRGARTGSRKKPSGAKAALGPTEILARFVVEQLPTLESVLVVVVAEDYEKRRRLATGDPLVQLAQKHSSLFCFREASPQFAFFDALFARNGGEAIRLWREWLERAGNSPRPYTMLASQLRLLIQAKMLTMRLYERRQVTREIFERELLPDDADHNVTKLVPDWRREKFLRAAANFSLAELLEAYEKLEPLQEFAIPLSSDAAVPDRELLSEIWILDFCGGRGER